MFRLINYIYDLLIFKKAKLGRNNVFIVRVQVIVELLALYS